MDKQPIGVQIHNLRKSLTGVRKVLFEQFEPLVRHDLPEKKEKIERLKTEIRLLEKEIEEDEIAINEACTNYGFYIEDSWSPQLVEDSCRPQLCLDEEKEIRKWTLR